MTQANLTTYILNVMDKHAELGANIVECLQYGRNVSKETKMEFKLLTIYVDILEKYTVLSSTADESVNCLTREQMKLVVQGINKITKRSDYLSFVLN